MLDEIFGSTNYVSEIACINKPSGRSDDKYRATAHESIVVYKKSNKLRLGGFEPEGIRLRNAIIKQMRLVAYIVRKIYASVDRTMKEQTVEFVAVTPFYNEQTRR